MPGKRALARFIMAAVSLIAIMGASACLAAGRLASLPLQPVLLSPIVGMSVSVSPIVPLNPGQSANVIARWSGGTPPYTVMWYSGPYQSCQSDSKNFRNDTVYAGSSDLIFVYPSVTTWYCFYLMDSKGQSALSPAAQVVVFVPPTTIKNVTSASTTIASANSTAQAANATTAASSINAQLCSIVNSIRNMVGVLSLTLFLLGGVLFAISHFLPTNLEFKKSLHTWSTTMIVGAVIALVIVIAAKPLLQLIMGIIEPSSGAGAITISC